MLYRISNKDKELLNEKLNKLVFDPYYQYVSDLYLSEDLYQKSYENRFTFISKNKEDIIGLFAGRIFNNKTDIVEIYNCINFNKGSKIFGRDLRRFILLLKQYGIKKIEWICCDGNPAKKMYDKIKGVRYIGYYSNAVIHRGKETNIHLYEMFL